MGPNSGNTWTVFHVSLSCRSLNARVYLIIIYMYVDTVNVHSGALLLIFVTPLPSPFILSEKMAIL